jgi:hypothetical protein
VDFVFLSDVASANTVAGKITEPANPTPTAAIAPIKERRSLNPGPDWIFRRFFDVITYPPLVVLGLRRFSITEIVCLSIKITLGTPEGKQMLDKHY